MNLEKRLIEYWRKNHLSQTGAQVIVACSGGPDSLALLDMVHRLQATLRINVMAAHFEHGIRGEASQADAEFVQEYCVQRVNGSLSYHRIRIRDVQPAVLQVWQRYIIGVPHSNGFYGFRCNVPGTRPDGCYDAYPEEDAPKPFPLCESHCPTVFILLFRARTPTMRMPVTEASLVR